MRLPDFVNLGNLVMGVLLSYCKIAPIRFMQSSGTPCKISCHPTSAIQALAGLYFGEAYTVLITKCPICNFFDKKVLMVYNESGMGRKLLQW